MTFPTKLIRLQIGGSLYTTEMWSMSFHFTTAGDVAEASTIAPAVEAWFDSLDTLGKHATANLGFVKFNELDHITGKYSNPGASNSHFFTPEITGPGPAAMLAQGTTCVSLRTALERGRGHAGRVYFPGYHTVASNGRLNPGQASQVGDSIITMMNAITLFDPALTAVIWSKIGDLVVPITGSRVGDVVDTQRRRRGALKEIYTTGTVVIE
jgi:hypothetical protein